MEDKNKFVGFYKNIISKKHFYLIILFMAFSAYGFSIFNRTISWDDLMWYHYQDIMLSGRWGMIAWSKLTGLVEFDPYSAKMLTLFCLCLTAIALCYLLYEIGHVKSIWAYTLTASAFVTYPLFNEIWEYYGANYILSGGMLLSTLSVIVVRSDMKIRSRMLVASTLMILPMSSYESAVFYYIALICIAIFYEHIAGANEINCFRDWYIKILPFTIPLIVSFIIRIIVSVIINAIFGLEYHSGGATEIYWLMYNPIKVLIYIIGSNAIDYFLCGLIYFPITIFSIFLLSFIYRLLKVSKNKKTTFLLGALVVLSLFTQAFIQGQPMPYRNAQTIMLFVSFVIFLFSSSTSSFTKVVRYAVLTLLFGICWHQAVYTNRILSLNNLRSENELYIVRKIGSEISSNYEKKPVVVVAPYQINSWIRSKITANDETLNGRLFYYIHHFYKQLVKPYKYVRTNVNSATEEYPQIQLLFEYCGYDVDVIEPRPKPHTIEYKVKDRKILNEAIAFCEKQKLKPYQIYDNGEYLIVNMGGRYFENGFYSPLLYIEDE